MSEQWASIEQSPLWQRTFSDSSQRLSVERLVVSLRNARERVALLSSRIVGSLPSLTQHDVSHLDGLWTVASTIAGDDYNLNPVEGFVFGMAVLLHDAALCHEAYKGGRDAVRATSQWRDAYHRRLSNQGSEDLDETDFEALRALHANQSAELATSAWQSPHADPWYIIDDADLRTHYGPLIGQIASSHHWDIEDVASQFAVSRPPAAFLPANWSVDPLPIACLLRAADAGHIDSSRAPTFLLKVLEMNSVSKSHWEAQNRLGQLTPNPTDPTQLVVASTVPFPEAAAPAWWVAFDLASQLDRELRQCDSVLRSARHSFPRPFARLSVAAAGRPRELARHVETQGWEPTAAAVHVSDVAALVGRLGGDQLYGSDADVLKIALRELIQNAADAITARRLVDSSSFEGRIRVRLLFEGSRRRLQVDDDGVGMSSQTLSQDLLDFGKSFWASERASSEFPGIHAAKLTPIGRFGIGFFSIFMAAAKARVFSRRFDSALEDLRCLSFDSGLSLRPTLSNQAPDDARMDVSTRVEIELKPTVVLDPQNIRIPCNVMGQQPFHVPFQDYVASLVAGVRAPVSVEVNGRTFSVHKGFPPDASQRRHWLESVSYVRAGVNQRAAGILDDVSTRLRELRHGNTCYGFACLRVNQVASHDFLTAKSVGGFVTHDSHGPFCGMIDHFPASAKREPGKLAAPQEAINSWLSEQVALLGSSRDPIEGLVAGYSLCEFDYDPIEVTKAILVVTTAGPEIWHLADLPRNLHDKRLGFRLSSFQDSKVLEAHGEQETIPGYATCHVLRTGKFNNASLSNAAPDEAKSLIGIIHRTLVNQGARPVWSIQPGVYRGPFGRCDLLEVRI